MMAALAFDVGQALLDRRAQQNAADAAALAGSRYLTSTTPAYQGTCSGAPGGHAAVSAACAMAADNGFVDGANQIVVTVNTPPGPASVYSGVTGFIEVNIRSNRTSFFQGRLLPDVWRVAAMGVATNGAEGAAPYSLIALNETACPSVLVSGQGSLTTGSNIQVNSSCPTGALQTTGNAYVDVTSPTGRINVVGDWSSGGNANVDPPPTEGSPWQPDPLQYLPAPPIPLPPEPRPAEWISGPTLPIPDSCPGGASRSTATVPQTCQFPSSYAGTTWRLYPGYYPGGLHFQAGTFLLEPGIYYIAGGGVDANGNGASIYSVDAGGSVPTSGPAGGVMFYNTEVEAYTNECAGNGSFPTGVTAATACLGAIRLNGSVATIWIRAIQTDTYTGIVIYQDRDLSLDPTTTPIASRDADVQINGSASTLNVLGTVYVPAGLVQANGSGGTASTVQIIADMFKITGSNANLSASYDGDAFFKLKGIGLVE